MIDHPDRREPPPQAQSLSRPRASRVAPRRNPNGPRFRRWHRANSANCVFILCYFPSGARTEIVVGVVIQFKGVAMKSACFGTRSAVVAIGLLFGAAGIARADAVSAVAPDLAVSSPDGSCGADLSPCDGAIRNLASPPALHVHKELGHHQFAKRRQFVVAARRQPEVRSGCARPADLHRVNRLEFAVSGGSNHRNQLLSARDFCEVVESDREPSEREAQA